MKYAAILIGTIIILGLIFIPQLRIFLMVTFLNLIKPTKFTVDENNSNCLNMTGLINSKSFKQLKKVMEDNPSITTIIMIDVPGSLNDEVNIEMCTWIRDQKLNTYLKKDSHVASGGTDLFLAGVSRTYEQGAKVGVHSWRSSTGKEAKDVPRDDKAHELYTNYTKKMLGSDRFYWFTIYAADAGDIHYMSFEEMTDYQMYTKFVLPE